MIGDGYEPEDGRLGWSDWTWFKVRGNKLLRVIVLSETPVHYRGHYHKGRMNPCLSEDCKLCEEHVGEQMRYVFGVVEVTDRRIGLLEVGRSVALLIRDWEGRNDGLRGMELHLSKESYAKNSRMVVEYVASCEGPWWRNLEVPDVRGALVATWRKAGFDCGPIVPVSNRVSALEKEEEAPPNGKRRWRPPTAVKG